MAILIPTLSTCLAKMNDGERRLAHRLEDKLESDYLCWYDVPVGPQRLHPDFIVLHPRRGLLILEVKDWKLERIKDVTKTSVTYLTLDGPKEMVNPLEQARKYAHAVVDTLAKDTALAEPAGSKYQGKLICPWGYGVVFSQITRKAFEDTDLGEIFGPHRVICQDEMTESVDPAVFQERLWRMFNYPFRNVLTMPQIDRIRWHLFPDIRINPKQLSFFNDLQPSRKATRCSPQPDACHGPPAGTTGAESW